MSLNGVMRGFRLCVWVLIDSIHQSLTSENRRMWIDIVRWTVSNDTSMRTFVIVRRSRKNHSWVHLCSMSNVSLALSPPFIPFVTRHTKCNTIAAREKVIVTRRRELNEWVIGWNSIWKNVRLYCCTPNWSDSVDDDMAAREQHNVKIEQKCKLLQWDG